MDRTLTRILLAKSRTESTLGGSCDNDGFCCWQITPELFEGAMFAVDGSDSASHGVVDTMTRLGTVRLANSVDELTYLSYNDIVQRGCVSRRTFRYLPDNGTYIACKTAARVDMDKQRRRYGLARVGKTKPSKGGSGAHGTALSRRCLSDDRVTPSKPASPRQPVLYVDQLQHCADQCTQNSESSCDYVDVKIRSDLADVILPSCSLTGSNTRQNDDTTCSLAQAAPRYIDLSTTYVDGHKDCTETIRTSNGQEHADSGLVKTWLYNFLPPIMTAHGVQIDSTPAPRNLPNVRTSSTPSSAQRQKNSKESGVDDTKVSVERRQNGDQNLTVVSRGLQTGTDDDMCGSRTASRRTQRSSATVHHVDSKDDVRREGRRRRRKSMHRTPVEYQVYVTETCLLPDCDCEHHQQLSSDDLDTFLSASHGRTDDVVDDDDDSDISNDGGDDAEDEAIANEALKSALKSFNSRLTELDSQTTASERLKLSLSGHVIDIRTRHRAPTCKS